MNALREVYDFITGGSIAAPVGLTCTIVAAVVLPAWRSEIVLLGVALSFVASTFETPT